MQGKFKKIIFCIYFSILMILPLGCWDNLDITERTFVSAIGLDKGENEQIEVTLQILRPNIIKGNREGGSGEPATWVSTTTSETVFEAIRSELKTVNRKLFYSHLRIIVIGEELAREGIRDKLDFFLRDHEVKITPKLIVAKEMKAKDIINASSELENIPALHLEGILENNVSEAKTREVNLIDVLQELTAPHGSGVIGSIAAINKGEVSDIRDLKIEGAAILKEDKLIGYLNPLETRGSLFLRDEVKGGIIAIDNPEEEGKKIGIEIKRAVGKIEVSFEEGELVLKGRVKLQGIIGEQQGTIDLANQPMLEKVEEAVEEEIRRNITSVLKIAQDRHKDDFFGFGSEVARKYPQYWEEIKNDWNEEFSRLQVELSIAVEIDRTGIIAGPIQFE